MSVHRNKARAAQALSGNAWVSQLEAETDRGDRAESALHASQMEAADVMLRATESAEALLAFAEDAAQEVVRTAQERAESVLALASETAEQLLKEAESDSRFKPPDDVHKPYSEGAQRAEDMLEESRAAALTELRLRQARAAEALAAARTKASAILQAGRTQTPTD